MSCEHGVQALWLEKLGEKDWDLCWGVGIIYNWAASGEDGKRHILEMGKSSKLFINLKTVKLWEFPSSLLLYCSNRLDPVRIHSLLEIWKGIICLGFPLMGCVLGCQQLRWRYQWRKGWEPWSGAGLPEYPVPEGDYVQYPLPAVANEAEAESTQVKVFALKLSISLTMAVLPALGESISV